MKITNQRYRTKKSLTNHLIEKQEFGSERFSEINNLTKIPIDKIKAALKILIDKSVIVKSGDRYKVANF